MANMMEQTTISIFSFPAPKRRRKSSCDAHSQPPRRPSPGNDASIARDPTSTTYIEYLFDKYYHASRVDLFLGFPPVPRIELGGLRCPSGALEIEDVRERTRSDTFSRREVVRSMFEGRDALVRRTESIVRELGLPRPQDAGVMEWMPGMRILDMKDLPRRWRLIKKEKLKYQSLPWVAEDGINYSYMRPELYVVEAFYLSSLSMGEIRALIKKIAVRKYPQLPHEGV